MLHQTKSFVHAFTSSTVGGPNPPFDPVAITSELLTHVQLCTKLQLSRLKSVVLMLLGFAGFGKDKYHKYFTSSFRFTHKVFTNHLKDEITNIYPDLNHEAIDTSNSKALSILVDALIGTEMLHSLLIRHETWCKSQDANYWADLIVSYISTTHT